MQGPYPHWSPDSESGGPIHFTLRPPNTSAHVYNPESTSDPGELLVALPKVPIAAHMEAVAQLVTNECIQLINELLQQNAAKIDMFHTRLQTHKATNDSSNDPRALKTMFSSAWNDQTELSFLTDSVSWIDALLSPFRTNILAEDLNDLRPRLQATVRDLQAARNPLRASTEQPLNEEEKAVVRQFSDYVVNTQASSIRRKQLLESTSIDVATFEDLL